MKKTAYLLLLFVVTCQNNPGKTKAEKIDYLAQKAFDDEEFVGNILVADKGEIIYEKSFGFADQANKLLNTDTTKFLIASISKPITAILILQRIEQGTIRLDDPISKYFPKSNAHIGSISVHQLLTHTSGINEIIGKNNDQNISTSLENATLKFEPGSDFEYSNSGYVILKEIAEIATQQKYVDLIQTGILLPANMTSSGIVRTSTLGTIAKGYKDETQHTIVALDFPIENVDGAGSVYSTAKDLYKLDHALYAENLLSKAMTEQMLKQHVPEKYAYGWFVRERGGVWDVYWYKGNLPGFTSFMSRRTQKKQLIVLLSNTENADLSDLENGIARILKEGE